MGLRPTAIIFFSSHDGDGLTFTPLTILAVYLGQRSGFSTATDIRLFISPSDSFTDISGYLNLPPVKADTSLAIPITLWQSERLGVRSASMTWSSSMDSMTFVSRPAIVNSFDNSEGECLNSTNSLSHLYVIFISYFRTRISRIDKFHELISILLDSIPYLWHSLIRVICVLLFLKLFQKSKERRTQITRINECHK